MKGMGKALALGWAVCTLSGLGVGSTQAAQQGVAAVFQVAVPATQTPQEQAIVEMLQEESGRRGKVEWVVRRDGLGPEGRGNPRLVLAQRGQVEKLLPEGLADAWRARLGRLQPKGSRKTGAAEGFSIVTLPWRCGTVWVIAGNDVRGELFGVGWLLRHMSFAGGWCGFRVR
jgi:hypothetical protein